MNIIKGFFTLCFLLTALISQAKDGYTIKLKVEDAKDSMVYLCHYYGKGTMKVFKDDSAYLSNKGELTFKSTEKIAGGLYMILFKDQSANFEIILNNGDNFSIQVKKGDIYNSAKFVGESENAAFYEYQKFLTTYGTEYQKIEKKLLIAKTKTDSTTINDQLREKGKELLAYRNNIKTKYPNYFLSKLFSAITEPDIPTELPTLPNGLKDSLYPRNYYKQHYWDGYDFQDDRLIYSPIYERKLDDYLNKLVAPTPDSVQVEIDDLLKKTAGTEHQYKYTMWYLTRWTDVSKIMGMDKAFVYIVENYYNKGKAQWEDSAQLVKYKQAAQDFKYSLIGNPAIELKMQDMNSDKIVPLSSVDADYTLVIFWDPDCGHCKKEIPQFDSLYHAALKKYNVKIYGVNTEQEPEKWKKFVDEHHLNEGWIHVHDPNRTTYFRSFYNVKATPTLYLLDRKKVIRGKRLDHTNIVGLIEWLEKKNNETK
ncbi:MAG: DUF5106 domain-containing protein [Chitinophagaceae bacterium]